MEYFPGGLVIKNPSANAGFMGSIPGLGRSYVPQSNSVINTETFNNGKWPHRGKASLWHHKIFNSANYCKAIFFIKKFFFLLVNPTRFTSGNLDYFNCVDFEDPGDVIKVVYLLLN